MSCVAIIPARIGSKRIPGKNLKACAGKPLIQWTFEAAKSARRLERVLLSTDGEEVANLGRRLGVEAPDLRPASISGDKTPMWEVVQHGLQTWLAPAELPEAIVLLQPTSPLREARHIDEAVEKFFRTEADTLVSVVATPHQFHPLKQLSIDSSGWARPYLADGNKGASAKPLPGAFGRNGPSCLITRTSLALSGVLYGERIMTYEMAQEDSVDVDEPLDLELAEFLLLRRARRSTHRD